MGLPALAARSAFTALEHGFAFPNTFPPGKPVFRVRTPLATIPIGDASKGLCGGMVFAALDHQRAGRRPPADPDTPGLFDYLVRRLWASFHLPGGVLRIYQWMGRPDAAAGGRGRYPTATVPYLTAQREWPKVRAELDAGRPAPLMLIKTASRNPWDMGHNHQVLATGYTADRAAGTVTLTLYEPNYPPAGPADEPVELRFRTDDFDGRRVHHSREGESVRGFFLNHYTPRTPPEWR
ncbi:MAG TPA: hypothetical protein VH092_31960 [Urbifossiella sp.]|jgi:hypothetical protein|nr:hypothetical protein [Urbifossiella sp.]